MRKQSAINVKYFSLQEMLIADCFGFFSLSRGKNTRNDGTIACKQKTINWLVAYLHYCKKEIAMNEQEKKVSKDPMPIDPSNTSGINQNVEQDVVKIKEGITGQSTALENKSPTNDSGIQPSIH